MQPKADADDFLGRFREIVSDPLNLLIKRHPLAGIVNENLVHLHNGHRVPLSGPYAYYGDFSKILVINRGVHEPLEEYVFQELLNVLPKAPTMLELGAYWGHYSMWLKKMHPKSTTYLVEPDEANLKAGMYNFNQHGYKGKFIQAVVGKGQFEVDAFIKNKRLSKLHVLHADIQGYEIEMLDGCSGSLHEKSIDYIFISTHSQEIHNEVINKLNFLEYRIEVSSDVDIETTSFDGFVFASTPRLEAVFNGFSAFGREQIIESQPLDIVNGLLKILNATNHHERMQSLTKS